MEISKEKFFSEIKFDGQTLEQGSIDFLDEIYKEGNLGEILDEILGKNIFFAHLSLSEIILVLSYIENHFFNELQKNTQFATYNLLVYSNWQTGNVIKALKIIQTIEKEYSSEFELLYTDTLNCKGGINNQLGKFDDALVNFYKALTILNNNKEDKNFTKKLITLNNNIAMVHCEQNEFEKAFEIYFSNLELQEKINDEMGKSNTCLNIGHTYYCKNDLKNSTKWVIKAQELNTKTGNKVYSERLNINIASNFIRIGDLETAKTYIEKSKQAKDIFTKNLAKFYDLRIHIQTLKKSELDITEQDKNFILKKANVSLELIEDMNDMSLVLEHYDTIAEAYNLIDDLKRANEILNKKFKLYSEYVEQQKTESYKQIRAMHEIQLQEKELEKKENQNRQLTKINEELEQFTYMATHDLQSPLRNINAFSSLINDPENTSEDLKEYTDLIISNATKMSSLISSLLKYSKIGFNKVEMAKFSLNKVLEKAKENLHKEIKDKSPIIESEDLPEIYANNFLMIQLFQNLLGNALKYSDKGLIKIEISTFKNNGNITIAIKDNGIGIPANKINDIFKAFSRAHSSSNYEGTGIGLATCKKIMEIHSGEISVTSKENEGSTFLLTFTEPD